MIVSPKVAIIIPARFKSSRFPGKPLALISGKTLIMRVWERCVGAIPGAIVCVATDDARIASHCETFGANVVLTPDTCLTGTDRICSASDQIAADIYVNVQGDEPLIEPQDIRRVVEAFIQRPERVHCAMTAIFDTSEFLNLNVPKVVTTPDHELVYISRAAIPGNKEGRFRTANKQVCIYAFSKHHLNHFASIPEKTPLEEVEDIEILRFIETGVRVEMVPVSGSSIAVDIPSDVAKVEAALLGR